MTADYASRAEILKLARVLDVEPARLDYLARVDADDLKAFRGQVTDTLFDANSAVLQRMALAARLLPGAVLAKIAEKVFGPLLCARIAGLVDVSRGVDVAKRLHPRFLAEVAAELDPRRASAIISRIPLDTVLAVAAELARREDWITLGRFVGHLPDPTVRQALERIDDPGLLRIAFVLDDKGRIDHVVGLLPAHRLGRLITAAGTDEDLRDPALDLLTHLSAERRGTLAPMLGGLPDGFRERAQATIKKIP
ncbi:MULTISPECIES: hypothetical protein [unclassified Amycolatopsis]|uniref:hypothetical protein n=1 Tax=unclassified Amycolatopsis TaxID=2618356 RepID=UPI001FF30905|nr:hypothetical protein [Amycolatopsis sp. FBCC-B4732]UOX86056.1 hypothetical protein MUY14_30355 [Amycolatopsis sp. FBCC-B4732]